jgi:hypothetical protein
LTIYPASKHLQVNIWSAKIMRRFRTGAAGFDVGKLSELLATIALLSEFASGSAHPAAITMVGVSLGAGIVGEATKRSLNI